MTSVERTGKHTYGVDEKPDYSILTYTWGRFRAALVTVLPVLQRNFENLCRDPGSRLYGRCRSQSCEETPPSCAVTHAQFPIPVDGDAVAAAVVAGPGCSLQWLEWLWRVLPWRGTYARFGAAVMLDRDGLVLANGDQRIGARDAAVPLRNDYKACRRLIASCRSANLQVVLLGRILDEWQRETREEDLETCFGLIVYCDTCWRRIGIRKWEFSPSRFLPSKLPLWEEDEFALY